MKQMFITSGISGSGKSTWAKELCKKDHSFIRVNRDSLREMMVGYMGYFDRHDIKQIEKIISIVCNDMIKLSLRTKNVIVDNTHLSWIWIERLINIAQEEDTFVCIKMFDVDLNIAQNRVYRRDNNVQDDEQEWVDYSNEKSVQYIENQLDSYNILKGTIEHELQKNDWYKQGKVILI